MYEGFKVVFLWFF